MGIQGCCRPSAGGAQRTGKDAPQIEQTDGEKKMRIKLTKRLANAILDYEDFGWRQGIKMEYGPNGKALAWHALVQKCEEKTGRMSDRARYSRRAKIEEQENGLASL
jgi:hypothetical protein